MLLKLNAQVVAKFKEKYKLETKVTPAQVKNIIRVDLEVMQNPEDDFEGAYIEDIEVEGEADDVPPEVTLIEVEDSLN